MITLKEVKVYKKYSGDPDMLGHVGNVEDKSLASDSIWHQIDYLIWGLSMIKSEMAYSTLVSKIEAEMQKYVDTDETRNLLREMAEDTRKRKSTA